MSQEYIVNVVNLGVDLRHFSVEFVMDKSNKFKAQQILFGEFNENFLCGVLSLCKSLIDFILITVVRAGDISCELRRRNLEQLFLWHFYRRTREALLHQRPSG